MASTFASTLGLGAVANRRAVAFTSANERRLAQGLRGATRGNEGRARGLTQSKGGARGASRLVRAHSFGWDKPAPMREPSYVVMWPTGFAEVASAITALRDGRTVVINLSSMPNNIDEQQRSVDFVAGGCHALGGRQERLSDGIFLFTPPDVIVATSDATHSYSPYISALEQKDALVSLARTSLSNGDPVAT